MIRSYRDRYDSLYHQLSDAALYRVLHVEAMHSNLPLLPETMGSSDGLPLLCWVHAGLHEYDVVGRGQVEAHGGHVCIEEEEGGGRVVLEGFESIALLVEVHARVNGAETERERERERGESVRECEKGGSVNSVRGAHL